METPQRRRGVRASRAKLVHALTEAGFRTQAALAERIADIEGLDVAPKDVVSRVFRELPVDPMTVERVARALGVDAHTLYKTSDEDEPVESRTQTTSKRQRSRLLGIVLLAVAAGIAVTVWQWLADETVSEPGPARPEAGALDMGTAALAVMPFDGDVNHAFAGALRKTLGLRFNVARPTADTLTQSLNPADVAERLRADVVVNGELQQVGRLTAIRVYVFKGGIRQQVWSDSVPAAALEESLAAIATEADLAIRQAVGMPVPENSVGHFPIAPVQDDYLEGEFHLDRPSNELNIKRAQSRFESALRKDSNYARAHAGLCQTLLEEHWMDSEERALEDASLACGRALQLDRDDRVVAVAHAHFLARTGRNEDAISLYRKVVQEHPKDAAALAGLASSLLEAYRESGEPALLIDAKNTARQAATIDSHVWKPLFFLATMEWFDGNVGGAIQASEQALSRDENEYVLANLGSFYLCAGSLEKARDAYSRARDLNPQSYVGDEFLGQAHYFLGHFERSAELRQRAIDSVANGNPEIHEMWGNLGDSYRQAGNKETAIAAYLRAAEIAERDYLRGTVPVDDQAARAYYYTTLAVLDPGAVPASVLETIRGEIDAIAERLVSGSALRRMAQTYLLIGAHEKAAATLSRATASCPGYALMPDLQVLSSGTRNTP